MDDIISIADGKVQVIFEKTDGTNTFRDALWFLEEEYVQLNSQQISDMQQERYNNWYAVVTAMPTEE